MRTLSALAGLTLALAGSAHAQALDSATITVDGVDLSPAAISAGIRTHCASRQRDCQIDQRFAFDAVDGLWRLAATNPKTRQNIVDCIKGNAWGPVVDWASVHKCTQPPPPPAWTPSPQPQPQPRPRPQPSDDWRRICAAEYPDDFAMQAACQRNAQRGHEDFVSIFSRYRAGHPMERALLRCLDDYIEALGIDWSMAGACARNQQRGYEDVQR